MLIHFPSALLPMDFVCYGLFYYNHQASFGYASFYALAGAVIAGWAAALFGILDILKIPTHKTDAMQKALIHGGINVSVIIVYTVLAYSAFKKYPTLPDASLSLLIAKAFLVSFMIIGNYIGGSLILKYKISIEE
ncbi:MAG: DUF2231 domain-containing protein [Ginsengibacter sp.]